jgi:hypothetical protein
VRFSVHGSASTTRTDLEKWKWLKCHNIIGIKRLYALIPTLMNLNLLHHNITQSRSGFRNLMHAAKLHPGIPKQSADWLS